MRVHIFKPEIVHKSSYFQAGKIQKKFIFPGRKKFIKVHIFIVFIGIYSKYRPEKFIKVHISRPEKCRKVHNPRPEKFIKVHISRWGWWW